MPFWLRHKINQDAGENDGYGWTVKGIEIQLWRAAYSLQGVTLRQRQVPAPVFTAEKITAAIRLKDLFRAPLSQDVEAFQPHLRIFLAPEAEQSKPMTRPDWLKLLRRLTLFRLSSVAIRQGEIRFQDPQARPEVELSARDVDILADNLFRAGADSSRWTGLSATGKLMGSGTFRLRLRIQPEAKTPTSKLEFSLRGMELQEMNAALLAYAGMAVVKGRLDLETRASASGGAYKGTVRSSLSDFQMADAGKKGEGVVKKVERKVAGVVGKILEKKSEKNAAEGKAPPEADFSGRFPEGIKDAWSESEYLLKESLRKGLAPR